MIELSLAINGSNQWEAVSQAFNKHQQRLVIASKRPASSLTLVEVIVSPGLDLNTSHAALRKSSQSES